MYNNIKNMRNIPFAFSEWMEPIDSEKQRGIKMGIKEGMEKQFHKWKRLTMAIIQFRNPFLTYYHLCELLSKDL